MRRALNRLHRAWAGVGCAALAPIGYYLEPECAQSRRGCCYSGMPEARQSEPCTRCATTRVYHGQSSVFGGTVIVSVIRSVSARSGRPMTCRYSLRSIYGTAFLILSKAYGNGGAPGDVG